MSNKQATLVSRMLDMQKKLNDDTNGRCWELGVNKNKKSINWKRCIYMECCELIDSFPWKHWKDINSLVLADKQNIKIEIVDIWHFIMSFLISDYTKKKREKKLIYDILKYINYKSFNKKNKNKLKFNQDKIINLAEKLISNSLKKDIKAKDILNIFFDLCINSKINLEELYKIYVAKNVLNKFRQDNGYKEGKYKKVWDKIEDNVIAMEIIDKNKNIDANSFYKMLSLKYKILN